MEHRLLGSSGWSVPVLTLGTATFGGGTEFFKAWGTTGVEEATRLVDICLEAGVTLFDTADVYSDGQAEEILGQAIAGRRHRLAISTKAAFRMGAGANQIGCSRHHLIEACEASLRRLGTDHIDLYHMHAFDAKTPIEVTVRALDDLVRSGKVRAIGCSNFSGWHLMKSLAHSDHFALTRYCTQQVYYSLLGREYEWELMPLALDQNVAAMVWSPLAGGLLSGKIGRQRSAPPGSRIAAQGGMGPQTAQEQLYAVTDVLEAIAQEVRRTVAQVALNWVLCRPSVATVVMGARNERQLRDNLEAVTFTLSSEQIRRLDQVSARPEIYPYWHQHGSYLERNPPPVPQTPPGTSG